MGTEIEDLLLAAWKNNFQRELWARFGQTLPRETCDPSFFDDWSIR